jgi:2,4-dienoyl-CoA reductase (NADPH2)
MTRNKNFEKLLEPGYIGTVKIRNRIIKSSAGLQYTTRDEYQITDKVKFLYEALARGGVGLLNVEGPSIDPDESRYRERFRLDDDRYIKGFSDLVKIIHKQGCPTFVQLAHTGNWQITLPGRAKPAYSDPPRAASPVCLKSQLDNLNEMPREMTIAEIQDIVDKFASGAVRVQKAGFDGVEINAACSHLFNSFLSPYWNKRQDAYGCASLENRSRFLVEVIKEIKKRLGKDYPVSVIINGIEIGKIIGARDDECLTAEDSRGIARLLQQAGADAIQVRSYWMGMDVASFLPDHIFYPEPPIDLKQFPEEYDGSRRGVGANVRLAAAMKKALTIPIITVGRLDPELGEKILREGKADFICMSRRLFADPELPNKIASGRLDDIAPCTACGNCIVRNKPRRCRINAIIGTEEPYFIKPAEKKKKVVVIGGGPAGMEAARVASLRGHEVTLYEKTSKLGGMLPMAAFEKGLEIENLPIIIRYLKGQIIKQGVKLRLGQAANASLLEKINPDVVILAQGGIPIVPDIPGIKRKNVTLLTNLDKILWPFLRIFGPGIVRWATQFYMPVGKRVVVMGGDFYGCELSEFLVKRGRQVTIVDTAETLGAGMVDHLKLQLFQWFRNKNVSMMPGIKYLEITDKGLTILNKEGVKQTLEADTIIPSIRLSPNTELLKALNGKISEVYPIGDCREPNLIADAIADGFRIARKI